MTELKNSPLSPACDSDDCRNEEPVEPLEPPQGVKWQELTDSFLMLAFAVGVYSQVFSFFLYAIS